MNDSPAIPAGFWRRFAAHAIDMGVLVLATVLFAVVVGAGAALLHVPIPEMHTKEFDIGGNLVGALVCWLYYALQESSWRQATVGKRLMGIEVTDLAGERITFLRATARYFAGFLSWITFLAGFVMAAFTARKQALHDMVAATLVTRTGAPERTGWVVFALVMLVSVGATVAVIRAVMPFVESIQRHETLPALVLAADDAADAVERYATKNHALPVAIEDTDFHTADDGAAPLVSLDAATARMAIAMRDGSVILIMTPAIDSTGHVTWECRSEPEEPENYPERCAQE